MLIKKRSLPPKPLLGADENWKKKKNMKIQKGLMTNYFFLNVEIVFSIGFLKKRFLYFFSIRFVSCFLKPSLWTEPNQILPHPDLLKKIIKFAKIFLSLILLPPFFLKNVKSILIIRIWKIYKCLTKNIIQKSELRHLVTFSTTTLYNTLLPYCFLQLRLQLQLQLKLQLMLHTLRFSHYIFRYTGCFTLS